MGQEQSQLLSDNLEKSRMSREEFYAGGNGIDENQSSSTNSLRNSKKTDSRDNITADANKDTKQDVNKVIDNDDSFNVSGTLSTDSDPNPFLESSYDPDEIISPHQTRLEAGAFKEMEEEEAEDAIKLVGSAQTRQLHAAAMDMLAEIPPISPIIPATLEKGLFDYGISYSKTGYQNKDIQNTDAKTTLYLCRRFQTTMKEESESAANNQKVLTQAIKDVEEKMEECHLLMNKREKTLIQFQSSMQEVNSIGKSLALTRDRAFRVSEMLLRINQYLPEDDRFDEFIWDVTPKSSVVDIIERERQMSMDRLQTATINKMISSKGQSSSLPATSSLPPTSNMTAKKGTPTNTNTNTNESASASGRLNLETTASTAVIEETE